MISVLCTYTANVNPLICSAGEETKLLYSVCVLVVLIDNVPLKLSRRHYHTASSTLLLLILISAVDESASREWRQKMAADGNEESQIKV